MAALWFLHSKKQILCGLAMSDAGGWLIIIGMVLLFSINIFLSIALRKKRSQITEEIMLGVPDNLKGHVSFSINSNMSWVFASLGLYTDLFEL